MNNVNKKINNNNNNNITFGLNNKQIENLVQN